MKKPAVIETLKKDGLNLDYNVFGEELEAAANAVGIIEGLKKKLQNADLLISPLTAKEAAASSKIEGTLSDASDVFLFEAGGETKHSDTKEVVNYRHAMNIAMSEIKKGREVTTNLIAALQGVLLDGVRHKGSLGRFRDIQVWIGEKVGDPIEKAIYIPPEPIHVKGLMDNLFDYIKNGKENALVKAGIMHYQFEAIHPFEDGNGRIGRLLIPLVLHQHQRLSSPILYLSDYFDEHRDEYISRLHAVDEGDDIEEWLKFFFVAISEQSKKTQQLIESIYKLHDTMRGSKSMIKSPYIIPFIDMLFLFPVFSIKMVQNEVGCKSYLTARALVNEMLKAGYIEELRGKKRNRLYRFSPLLKILK